MANNADWLNTLNYIDFLRDVGRHFSVNRMLAFESVKLRLERQHELSFLEFNYMILQAYDFVELYKRHGCVLQMGGSDQWGNIVNGIDLGRRLANAQLFALTGAADDHGVGCENGQDRRAARCGSTPTNAAPTTTGSTGATPRTATSSASSNCSPTLPLDEIAKLAALQGAEINEAKKILATEATALVHGRAAAEQAAETAQHDLRGGAPRRDAADRRSRARDARRRPRRALRVRRSCRAGRLQWRGAPQIKAGGLKVNDADRDRREDAARPAPR